MIRAYYNEINPFAIQTLKNLMKAGLIADGEIDTRKIEDVKAKELQGFNRCHFFDGIGGWSLALQIAGWPEEIEVWTGSCPCQPFSRAGKSRKEQDPRHLWPYWENLIEERKPSVVFGEQVEAAVKAGWLDTVHSDLEKDGYAFGASILTTLGIKSFQDRERIFFVGDTEHDGWDELKVTRGLNKAIHRSKKGEKKSSKFEGTDPPGMLSENSVQWKKYPHGKLKAIEPTICTMVDEFPGRMEQIYAWGNSIDPYLAAEFVSSYMDVKLGIK